MTAQGDSTTCIGSYQQPWEKAKAFDGSAPIGRFIDKKNIKNINNLNFHLSVNKKITQIGYTKNMIFQIDYIISYISQYITLKKGDLIFTGTPKGVGQIRKNDILEGFIENDKILEIKVK